jgi:hypothetical protein
MIEECFAKDPTRIVLTGRALPHRPIRWGGSCESSDSNFQGNNLTTFQVMYPKERPTTFIGRWKAEYIDADRGEIAVAGNESEALSSTSGTIGRNTFVNLSDFVRDDPNNALLSFCEVMDRIRAAGTLADVTWMGRTRRGLLKSFEYDIDDSRDITWEMTFEWETFKLSAGKSQLKAERLIAEIEKDWADRIDDFASFLDRALGFDPLSGAIDGYKIPILSDAFEFMNKLENQMRRIHSARDSLKRINQTIANAARRPFEIARMAAQTLLDTQLVLNDFADTWNATAVSEMGAWQATASSYDALFNGDSKPAFMHDMTNKEFEVRQATIDIIYSLAKDVRELQSKTESESSVRDIVIADDGMHIGQLANRYFRSFKQWPALARFNKIENPVLVGGQVILIPKTLSHQ